MRDLYFYIHWPFCESLCPYCDFNSFISENQDMDDFLTGYLREIEYYAQKCNKTHTIRTIFFGGGTPSLMKPSYVSKIIDTICQKFTTDEGLEITLEANPSSYEASKFKDFFNSGVNRISIGVQSFDDKNLKQIGRKHNKNQAIFAIESACNIFNNVSFDLMFGLPNQSFENLENEVNFAVKAFKNQHISLYNLTIEKGTEFFRMNKNNGLNLPDSELCDKMNEFVIENLENNGFIQYEISNFAKDSSFSKHNLGYWKLNDYIGIGAGAHGRVWIDGIRYETMNHHVPKKWLSCAMEKSPNFQRFETISKKDQVAEIIFMGLRITSGIDVNSIKFNTGIDILEHISQINLYNLQQDNFLDYNQEYIKPTKKGMMFVNFIAKCLLE